MLQHRTGQRSYPGQELVQELMVQQQLPTVDQLLILLSLEETERKKSPPPPSERSRQGTHAESRPRAAPAPKVSRCRNRIRALRQPAPPPLRSPYRRPRGTAAQLGLQAPHAPGGRGAETQVRMTPRGAAHQQGQRRLLRHSARMEVPPAATRYIAALHAPPTSAPSDRSAAVATSDWLRR